MTRKQRLSEIIHILSKKDRWEISELSEYLNISSISVRRDIAYLCSVGLLERFHGGVTSINSSRHRFLDPEYRNAQMTTIKQVLAAKAASLLSDNMLIYMDNSTTIQKLVPFLEKYKNITLVTSSLDILNLAEKYENISLITLEGSFDPSSRLFFPRSRTLSKYHFDIAFMGATSFSDKGTMELDIRTAEMKSSASEHSSQVIILGDHSKWENPQGILAIPFSRVSKIVTDRASSEHKEIKHWKGNFIFADI